MNVCNVLECVIETSKHTLQQPFGIGVILFANLFSLSLQWFCMRACFPFFHLVLSCVVPFLIFNRNSLIPSDNVLIVCVAHLQHILFPSIGWPTFSNWDILLSVSLGYIWGQSVRTRACVCRIKTFTLNHCALNCDCKAQKNVCQNVVNRWLIGFSLEC